MNSPAEISITCPSCGSQIKITEGSERFTCGYCGKEHPLADATQPAARLQAAPRAPIAAPASMQVIDDGQVVRVVQRWFSAKSVLIALLAVGWDATLVFWLIQAASGAAAQFGLIQLLQLAIGAYLTYWAVAGLLNRTSIELIRDELSVRIGPLPWPGAKTIQTADIKQMYSKEKVTRSSRGGTSRSYQLRAITKSGQDVALVSGLDSAKVAQFFEQRLETWLHIEDEAVAGEMVRR